MTDHTMPSSWVFSDFGGILNKWALCQLDNMREFMPKINRLRQESGLLPTQELVYFVCCDNLDLHNEEAQGLFTLGLKRKGRAKDVFFLPFKDSKYFADYLCVDHEYHSIFKEKMSLKVFLTKANEVLSNPKP